MEYRYKLDKSSKKFNCPNCGKKRFVRYIDNENDQYSSEEFGRCDREVKCGYHKYPEGETKFVKTIEKPSPLPYYIPLHQFKRTLSNFSQNNLYIFLQQIFGNEITREVFQEYKVGTSKKWGGATLFWQINYHGKVGQGKIMVFNKETGKRIKNPYPLISSVHALLKRQDQKPEYSLFGEHLLIKYPNKPIAIVESEKTAIIMSIIEQNYLWIASGGLSQLNDYRLRKLKNSKLVFYPDLGAYNAWNEKANLLNKRGFNIKVSNLLEVKSSSTDKEMGFDIADYYLKPYYKKANQTNEFKQLISNYPKINTLVNSLGLELITE